MPLTASQKEQLARAIEARHRALLEEIRGDPPGEPAARCIECQRRHEKTYRD